MSVWQSVGQQVGGIAKHVVGALSDEPAEIAGGVVSQVVGGPKAADGGDNQGMEAVEHGQGTQAGTQSPSSDAAAAGFKTQEDFQKYQELTGKRDDMELSVLRKRLQAQWGLDTDVDSGMQQARAEWEEKERQRKQAQEQKKEEKKMEELQVKKQEDDAQVKAAQMESSAENKAWGAG